MEALSQLHFIRPWWFVALPVLLALVLLCRRRRDRASGWQRIIDPALLAPLLEPVTGRAARLPYWLAAVAAAIAVVGLAGPSTERLAQPTYSARTGLIVVLDLSPSMRAADLDPDRITFARRKLRDVLGQRGDGETALVVYSGDAHVVTPLTDDVDTIALFLPSLRPSIMPVAGDRPIAGFRKAAELATDGGIEHARVLWVTDHLPDTGASALGDFVRKHNLAVSVLGIGSKGGAPIPKNGGGFMHDANGAIVIARLDADALEHWTASVSGRYATAAVGDADISYLLAPLKSRLARHYQRHDTHFDEWRDSTAAFALALLPLVALAFRRGWILLALLLVLPPHADAFSRQDLWLRPDQQGMRALHKGKPGQAAQRFRDPAWRGTALYRAGQYAAAARAFEEDHSADGHYNRANALARAGKLRQALDAYRQALKIDPDNDDARHNRAAVERLLKKREQQQRQRKQKNAQQPGSNKSGAQSRQGQTGNAGKPPSNGPHSQNQDNRDQRSPTSRPPDRQPGQRDDQRQQQTRGNQQPRSGEAGNNRHQPPQDRQSGAAGTESQNDQPDKSGAARAGQPDEHGQHNDAEAQVMNQWLRQIPDDPGELLRRKFEYEHRREQSSRGFDRNE